MAERLDKTTYGINSSRSHAYHYARACTTVKCFLHFSASMFHRVEKRRIHPSIPGELLCVLYIAFPRTVANALNSRGFATKTSCPNVVSCPLTHRECGPAS
jgi:hypothetical protein